MPAFPLLPPKDLEAVVDYVLALTHRGELESKLAEEAEFNEQIEEQRLPEMVTEVLARWRSARAQVVYPSTPMPEFKKANIDEGKKAFLTIGCAKCHGDDGRGMMASNVGTDAWGNADQGGRPDLRDAPRGYRAAGHLPAHRRGHQRHADALVPRYAQDTAADDLEPRLLRAPGGRQPASGRNARFGDPRERPAQDPARREARGHVRRTGDRARTEQDGRRAGRRPDRSGSRFAEERCRSIPRRDCARCLDQDDEGVPMSMDVQAKLQELEHSSRGSRCSRTRSPTARSGPGWRATGYYSAYYATAGFLLGSFGAMASLLFNVVGAPLAGKSPLELIRVYLTFPLGEKALQLDRRGRTSMPSTTA